MSIRILIIDDEAMIRLNLYAYLEDEGFEVFEASTGEQGLIILSQNHINILIVDMRLPHMDGNTVILEALKLNPSLQCIIHTGSNEYRVPPQLLALGIEPKDIILKPLKDMRDLIQCFKL